MDPGESFIQAAHRECLEEAAIEIEVKGILRVEHSVYGPAHARMRVVFFATPRDQHQVPKQFPDRESEEACWVTLEELKRLARSPPGLRGPELYEWGNYIEKGGTVAPLHFLCREDEPTPSLVPRTNNELGALIDYIERGDDSNLRLALATNCTVNSPINDKNWTLLHLACKLNQECCVELLLLANAEPALSTHKNRNALHFGACSSHGVLVSLLMSVSRTHNKLDLVNQQDSAGNTPLHFAAGHNALWDVLLASGADPEICNYKDKTPGDLASNFMSTDRF